MKRHLYVCSECGRGSWTMTISQTLTHHPSALEIQEKPELQHLQNEVLICTCGKVNTWYALRGLTMTNGFWREERKLNNASPI